VRSRESLDSAHILLERGKARGLARSPIEGKLSMGEQLIPSFDVLLHEDPKESPQSPIGYLGLPICLGVASGAKLEVCAHLSP